ncbi:hypothetical protein [Streptomyces sp. NBC_00046]
MEESELDRHMLTKELQRVMLGHHRHEQESNAFLSRGVEASP